ncbi:MAG: ABC-2 family transporter protein [Pseudomonadota bacterium]|nr:ABC-2 family transporter protein [Pseudomonadota bacterium]
MTHLLRKFLAQRLKVRLAYRFDFAVNALGDVLLAGVGLVFLDTLFLHVQGLGAYSPSEVLFCWGFAECVVGLFFVIFQGLWVLNQRYIVGGELDRVLLRPVDPYVHVLLDNVSLEDLPIALLGGAVMIVAAPGLGAVPAWHWVMLPVLLLGGACVLGGLLTIVSSAGFHLHHRGTAVGLVFQLSTFARYPIDLFSSPVRLLLTWALPLGFAGFYPASFLMDRPEWHVYALAQPLVGLAALALGYGAFRFGLVRYASTGS